jgi:signal transduction histidine kinase/sensor domain CHASE-containing protein
MDLQRWLKDSQWEIGNLIKGGKMFRNMKPSTQYDYLKACTMASGAITVSLGILIVIGWSALGIRPLEVIPGVAPKQINTAIGFILSGIALLAAARGMAAASLVCGGIAGSLGILTLIEDFSPFDLYINRHVTGAYVDNAAAYLRRMAPSTGVCFLLAGIAFTCSCRADRFWLQPPLIGMLGSIVIGIGAVALLGYLTGLSGTYVWGEFGGMDIPTALGFMVLGVGIIALAWVAGITEEMNSPRWLPLLVGTASLTVTFVLWQAILASEELQIEQIVRSQVINARNRVASVLDGRFREILRSATRRTYSELDSGQRARNDITRLLEHLDGFHSLGWIDSSNHLQWTVPEQENALLSAIDPANDPRQTNALAMAQTHGIAITPATGQLSEKGDGYVVYARVSSPDQRPGFILGFFHAQQMLKTIIDDYDMPGYAIMVLDGSRQLYRRPASDSMYYGWAQDSVISLNNLNWVIRVWPQPSVLASMDTEVDVIALVVGLLSSALLVVVTYLAQTSRLRARGIEVANQNLQREMEERRRALARVQALKEINIATTSTLDLPTILTVLLEKTSEIFPVASAASIAFYNAETGCLEPVACRGMPSEEWKAMVANEPNTLAHRVAGAKTPISAGNLETDAPEKSSEFGRKHGLVSYLGLPMMAKGRVLAVLSFVTKEAHEFSEDEIEFLMTLASETAIAIDNSKLYDQTKRQAEKLEEAGKIQADFTAMIAHDLRSPLSNIMGIAEMMENQLFGTVNEEQKNWLNRMRNNATGLVQLVSDFLDISKLEAGRIELSRKPTDIEDLVLNTVADHQPMATSKRIDLNCQSDASLRPIYADARRLDQVLNNLVSNALKFTGEGGTIQIRVRSDNDSGVMVQVQDSGVGIPREEIPNLFQKYRQASSATVSAQKGTGLGLVICKMIVEAHGGKIWVDSEEGKGAIFTVTLPFNHERGMGQNVVQVAAAHQS